MLKRSLASPRWARLLGLALVLGFQVGPVVGQAPRQAYRRTWIRDSHGAEVLFRPVDVVVTRNCQVWVSDAGNARVYRWGCDGRPLQALGRKGEGPGELKVPSTMQSLRGDTVAVWDHALARLTYFDAGGRLLGSRTMSVSGAEHGFVRALVSSYPEFLVATDVYPGREHRPDDGFTIIRAVDGEGRVTRSLARVQGPRSLVDRSANAAVRFDAPFAPRPLVLFGADGTAYVGHGGSAVVSRYRYGARLVPAGQVRLRIAGRPVTRRERGAWVDSTRTVLAADLERSGLDAAAKRAFTARHRRMLDAADFPREHPLYQLGALDPGGRLWLLLDEPGRRGGTVWQVYDGRTGALLRTVDVPTTGRVRAAAAGSDGLYVVEIDGDGVSRLARYAPSA